MMAGMEASWNPEAAEGVLEEKVHQIEANQVFTCRNLQLEKSLGQKEAKVTCQGENAAVTGHWVGYFSVDAKSKITRPVEYIRKLRALRQLVG